ncbi:MAG: hypothetical protein IPL96_14560 [Holophagaceae bacterium]|nr:hypothetical protein [Holophagaceae bacterium]
MRAFLLLALFALPALLAAQPVRPGREHPGGFGPGGGQTLRQRRLERMQETGVLGQRLMQIRMNRIQEVLGLPEERARVIAERWERYDRDFMERARHIGELRGRFNQILLGPGGEDEKNQRIKPHLDQFMELRRQQADLKKGFEDDIRAQLSPAQQVRLIILVEELQQRIREALKESLKGGQGQRFDRPE